MDAVFKAAWDAMERYSNDIKKIKINKDKKDIFVEKCKNLYKNFFKEYMNGDSKTLDRHKIGAIISVVGSSDDYIESAVSINGNEFFLGRYNIPIVVSLSFIGQEINKDLHRFKFVRRSKHIDLHIPLPASCETFYIDSLARMLRFEEAKNISDTLRVLELANTFFLIEECTLLKLKINMDKWVKLKRQHI